MFEITGDEWLTTADKLRMLSRHIGRDLRTGDVEPEKAVEAFQRKVIPPPSPPRWVSRWRRSEQGVPRCGHPP